MTKERKTVKKGGGNLGKRCDHPRLMVQNEGEGLKEASQNGTTKRGNNSFRRGKGLNIAKPRVSMKGAKNLSTKTEKGAGGKEEEPACKNPVDEEGKIKKQGEKNLGPG